MAAELALQNADVRKAETEAREVYEKGRGDLGFFRTLKACNALFARDEDEALLSPVCNPLFIANGLPTD